MAELNTPPEPQTPPESHEAFIQRTRNDLDALKAEMEKVAKESKDIEPDSGDTAMKQRAKELADRAEALHRKFDEKIEQLRVRFPSQESLLKATDSLQTQIDSIFSNTQAGPLRSALNKLNTKITDKNETGTTGMTLSERVEAVKAALPEKPLPQSSAPSGEATPEGDAEGSPKNWKNRISEGFQSFVGMLKDFKEMLQGFGTEMLMMLSSFAKMIGWNDVAQWLETLASNDASELANALAKSGVSMKQLKKPSKGDDLEKFKQQMSTYLQEKGKLEAPQTALANRYQELATSTKRGTAYKRNEFYKDVVDKWKAENPTAKECGAAELERMAVIAMDKTKVPDRTAEGPKNLPTPTPEKPGEVLAVVLPPQGTNMMESQKVKVNNTEITFKMLSDGLEIEGVRKYKYVPRSPTALEKIALDVQKVKPEKINISLLEAKRVNDGIAVKSKAEAQTEDGKPWKLESEQPVVIVSKEAEQILLAVQRGDGTIPIKNDKGEVVMNLLHT